MVADQLQQGRFQRLTLHGPLQPHHQRLHRHMGVVVVVMGLVVVSVVGLVVDRTGQAQHQFGVHPTPHHRQHGCTRANAGPQAIPHLVALAGADAVGPAHQHEIGTLQLFREQRIDGTAVVEAGICQALGLQGSRIGHHSPRGQGLAIHHGDHPIHPRATADLRPLEGCQKRFRQGQPAGFHQNSIERVGPLQQGLHGGQEVVLHRATEAAIGQFHQPTLQLLLGAEPTTAQQVAVNPDLPKFVDQHGQAQPGFQQEMAQQGGFARTEKPCHHRDRQAPGAVALVCHLSPAPWRGQEQWTPPSGPGPTSAGHRC